MPREPREVLDCSGDDEGDQSAGETRAPVPVVARDQQIQTHSQTGVQTGKKFSHLGGEGRGGGGDTEEEGEWRKGGANIWLQR